MWVKTLQSAFLFLFLATAVFANDDFWGSDWTDSPRSHEGSQITDKVSQAQKCTDLLLKANLQIEAYSMFSKGAYWNKWIDNESDFRRLIGKANYEASKDKMHPTEIYGVEVYLAWRAADRYLNNIPLGRFQLSLDLISEVHRIANKPTYKWLKKIFKDFDGFDGILPVKDGAYKKRFSIGREPLFRPLNEAEYQAVKNNPWLGGFWELPWPFSRNGKHRGVIVYARYENVQEKLNELIDWYEQNKSTMNPIELAARFQQAYVSIHPHVDGNGRVSRLLMDRILAEHGLPAPVLESHTSDLYLTPQEYTKMVSEGIDTYFEIAKENGYYLRESGTPVIGNSPASRIGRVSFNKPAFDTNPEKVPQPLSKNWADREIKLGGQPFTMLADGFFYSNKGIPYAYHEGKLYPIADKTYLLYNDGGDVVRDQQKQIFRKFTPFLREIYRTHFKLYREIEKGEIDAEKIEVLPYEYIAYANENQGYIAYEWQKPMLQYALEIRDSSPLEVLVRGSSSQTQFEQTAIGILKQNNTSEITPAHVLAQYEAVDFKYSELELYVSEVSPDLVPLVRESRAKIHQAARSLIKPTLEKRGRLDAVSQKAVSDHAGIRVWDEYFKYSKLSFESFQEGLERLGDKDVYLLRNDSFFASYTGFLSQADYRRYFEKLPGSQKIRNYFNELKKYVGDPKNRDEIQRRIKNAQKHIDNHKWVLKVLPEFLADALKDLQQAYPRYTGLLNDLVQQFFSSRYDHQGTTVEFERAFVDYTLHAGGWAGTKQGVSFTSSLDLLVPENWSEDPNSWTLHFTNEGVDAKLYIAKLPRNKISWDFASGFSSEYEFILNKPVGPWKIISSFTKKDLFRKIDPNIPNDAKSLIKEFGIGNFDHGADKNSDFPGW